MTHIKLFTTYFILLISVSCFAQIKKAEKYFNNAQYAQAIPFYKNVTKGTSSEKQNALIKLADCYRILNNYLLSETYYSQALAIGNVSVETHFNYGNILMSNNKYNEALTQYTIFLKNNGDEKKVKNLLKSCKEIKQSEAKAKEYEVSNVKSINTKRSEFCPVVLNNKLFYAAERMNDLIDFETSGTTNQPYLNIYVSKIKKSEVKKSKKISKAINSHFHDGPISFDKEGKLAAFTRVDYKVDKKNKNFVNRAKIYFTDIDGNTFSKPRPFAFNSDDYSCAHPSLNTDGSVLFFSSDMPGTLGGQDIWMCKKNGNDWSSPINLGQEINTPLDEVFPTIRQDGVLFFSSNGLEGFGDLDIYSAQQKNEKWVLNRNEGLSINSVADDFGITFTNDTSGYFSSNREGGKGEDDIYSFTYRNKGNKIVDGTILLTEDLNNPAKGIKVNLLDSSGQYISSSITNDKGYFAFKNLDVDKSYMVELDVANVDLQNKARFYLADENGKITRITHDMGNGKPFVFKNLPVAKNGVVDLYDIDDLSIAGNLLYGKNPSKPIANKKVTLTNSFGDVVFETTTNEFGAFAFKNLPSNQNYSISVEDSDLPKDYIILLTNKNGKVVTTTKVDKNGNFKFSLLNANKATMTNMMIEDNELIMTLNGYLFDQDKKAMANAKVSIYNTIENAINILTDENGKFVFKNLRVDLDYYFAVDDSDPRFSTMKKIYLADSKGRIYKELIRNSNQKFQFNLLGIDKSALGEFSVDDPWLEVLHLKNKEQKKSITIIENLYYAYGDFKIDTAGFNILDKVITVLNSDKNIKIEISSHTDSRSSAAYNLKLSQMRAKVAVDYLISKGIQKTRLKAVGYGESRLLNKCNDSTTCTEEEHAINRRTEFKIIDN